jgi:hypothetical protein
VRKELDSQRAPRFGVFEVDLEGSGSRGIGAKRPSYPRHSINGMVRVTAAW